MNGSPASPVIDVRVGEAWLRVVDVDDPGLDAAAPDAGDHADVGARRGEARRRFLRRRGALRAFAASRLGLAPEAVAIRYDPRGAPRLSEPLGRGFVSVAARGGLAALAVASRPVGVDIEPLDPAATPLLDTLSREESLALGRLDASGQAVAFLKSWTAKEAYLKALGVGLMRDPATLTVAWPAPDRFAIVDRGREARGLGRLLEAGEVAPLLLALFVSHP